MGRKRRDFRTKFAAGGPSSDRNEKNGHRTPDAFSSEPTTRIDDRRDPAEGGGVDDQRAVRSFLPRGTGISFVDAALARESLLRYKPAAEGSGKAPKTSSRLVLELTGPPRCGMTSVLLAVATRYVASTSNLFFDDQATFSGESPRLTKQKNNPTAPPTEPRVVILDIERGVHAVKLILSVREAVLRRWDETGAARRWRRDQERTWGGTADGSGRAAPDEDDDCVGGPADTVREQDRIDRAVQSCLGRIHVVQPRDFTYLGLVATIELLHQSLDRERAEKRVAAEANAEKRPVPRFGRTPKDEPPTPEPPTLVVIDSLSALDASTRFQEGLPAAASGGNRGAGGSGLSDRNEFHRQLLRLQEDHEVVLLGASRSRAAPNVHYGRAQDPPGGKRGGNNALFDKKMVSHRVALHHVVEGTREERAGYDFVATLNATDEREGAAVFPYSVTAGGIAC